MASDKEIMELEEQQLMLPIKKARLNQNIFANIPIIKNRLHHTALPVSSVAVASNANKVSSLKLKKPPMISIGSIPRSEGNSKFPITHFSFSASTNLSQGNAQTSPKQTALGKDFTAVHLPLMQKAKASNDNKPKKMKEVINPFSSTPNQDTDTSSQKAQIQSLQSPHNLRPLSNPLKRKRWIPNTKRPVNPFSSTPNQDTDTSGLKAQIQSPYNLRPMSNPLKRKRWLTNPKSLVNPDQHAILSHLLSNRIDVSTIRKIENSFSLLNKAHRTTGKIFNFHLGPITAPLECDHIVGLGHEELLVNPQDLLTNLFPCFFYRKNRWNKIHQALNKARDTEEFLKECYNSVTFSKQISIVRFTKLEKKIAVHGPIDGEQLWELLEFGFIKEISNFNVQMFYSCPDPIISFIKHMEVKSAKNVHVISVGPEFNTSSEDYETEPYPLQFWLDRPPREYPSIVLLQETDQWIQNFDKLFITPEATEEANFRNLGFQELQSFMIKIIANPTVQLFSDTERIICYQQQQHSSQKTCLKAEEFVKDNMEYFRIKAKAYFHISGDQETTAQDKSAKAVASASEDVEEITM